jgi:hypothetical protein
VVAPWKPAHAGAGSPSSAVAAGGRKPRCDRGAGVAAGEHVTVTEDIREQFGTKNALDYLVGEKLFTFVMTAEQDPEFAAQLPAFVVSIQRLFSAEEIRAYLDRLEHEKFLSPPEPEIEDGDEEEPWPANPVLGAQELLRFSRIRQLLQP